MKSFSIQNFFILHIFLLFLLPLAKCNPNALTGELRLRLDKFSEFVKQPVGTERKGDEVKVRGLSWHLKASINELITAKYIKIWLICTNDCKIDPNWNCYASSVIKIIVGQKEVMTKRMGGNFNERDFSFYSQRIQIENLLKECQSANEDSVEFVAKVVPDAPCGNSLPRTDILTVKSSGDENASVLINKNYLAAHSNFFNDLFNENGHADRGMSEGWNENVENVLRLANQFLVKEVEGKCKRFLTSEQCKIRTMKKLLIADKYGLDALGEYILYTTKYKNPILMEMSRLIKGLYCAIVTCLRQLSLTMKAQKRGKEFEMKEVWHNVRLLGTGISQICHLPSIPFKLLNFFPHY
uniref:MATH domain-containing protein n=1 Tax=Globodera rostochiensis TaxID=31243 RepID=A0A914IBW2_GLORO